MATRRRSSATATAPKAPAKKRASRTRKVTSTTKVVSLNKSQPLPVIVTEETKVDEVKVDTPQLNRPEKPNLSLEDYVGDVKVRWKIHSYETTILWNQSRNLYTQQIKPAFDKSVKYAKDSYDKAFNQDQSSETDNK